MAANGPARIVLAAVLQLESHTQSSDVSRCCEETRGGHAVLRVVAKEPLVDESDETLMVQAGEGSHDACHELVRRHLGRVVAFAGRSLGDRTDAEDVAQEVFERLWIHARDWRAGRARLTTWLHRVALNLCLALLVLLFPNLSRHIL